MGQQLLVLQLVALAEVEVEVVVLELVLVLALALAVFLFYVKRMQYFREQSQEEWKYQHQVRNDHLVDSK